MKILPILSQSHFSKVLKEGNKLLTKSIVILYQLNLTEVPTKADVRLGIIASKKSFARAVDRNLAKRRIKAAFRQLEMAPAPLVLDIVCIARRRILTENFALLVKEIQETINAMLKNKS